MVWAGGKMKWIQFQIGYFIYKIKRIFRETIPLNVAHWLPPRVQLWCFILVYGCDGDCPGPEYREKYDYFVDHFKLKDY